MVGKSDTSHAVLDVESRKKKARKIISILSELVNISECDVLDIGTGAGTIASEMGSKAKSVKSVDLYDERIEKKNYDFVKVEDEHLPFADNSFDVAISNHVIEHVPDQTLHAQELLRVLKPGGILYLATPNKAWLTDPHHKLPFISWLPRKLSNLYIKTVRNREWDIYPVSHLRIKKEFSKQADVTKGVPIFIKNKTSDVEEAKGLKKVLAKLPHRVLAPVQYFSPTLVYIIKNR